MRSALSVWRRMVLPAVRARASLLSLFLSLLTERPLSALRSGSAVFVLYLLFVILFLYCLAVCGVLNANNGVHGADGNFRTVEGLELKIMVGGFVLRFGFRWRFPAWDFIKIIAVSFALDQISLFNHQVYVCVEGCSADAYALFRVLLGQVEVITIGIRGKIEI